MGLELRARAPGLGEVGRLPVGSYSYVHCFRAALAAAFAARLWQLEGGNEDDFADYVLTWITKGDVQVFMDAEEVEYDEMAVGETLKSLDSGRFGIAYFLGPQDVWREFASKLHEGVLDDRIPQAFAGLVKLIHHSDCDGWLSPGDSVDVAACLSFIGDAGKLVLPTSLVEAIDEHARFFERVVEAKAWVEFR